VTYKHDPAICLECLQEWMRAQIKAEIGQRYDLLLVWNITIAKMYGDRAIPRLLGSQTPSHAFHFNS
jgi:hypothetical protein